jgi:hypothetical protein
MARLVFCSGDWGIRKRLEWWCEAGRVEQEVLFLMFLAVQNEKLSGSSHVDRFFLSCLC